MHLSNLVSESLVLAQAKLQAKDIALSLFALLALLGLSVGCFLAGLHYFKKWLEAVNAEDASPSQKRLWSVMSPFLFENPIFKALSIDSLVTRARQKDKDTVERDMHK